MRCVGATQIEAGALHIHNASSDWDGGGMPGITLRFWFPVGHSDLAGTLPTLPINVGVRCINRNHALYRADQPSNTMNSQCQPRLSSRRPWQRTPGSQVGVIIIVSGGISAESFNISQGIVSFMNTSSEYGGRDPASACKHMRRCAKLSMANTLLVF